MERHALFVLGGEQSHAHHHSTGHSGAEQNRGVHTEREQRVGAKFTTLLLFPGFRAAWGDLGVGWFRGAHTKEEEVEGPILNTCSQVPKMQGDSGLMVTGQLRSTHTEGEVGDSPTHNPSKSPWGAGQFG